MAVNYNPSKVRAVNSTGDFPNDIVISLNSEYTSNGIYCILGI